MRTLRRHPAFSFLCIAILGVSIGAAAAVLSAFHALFLKPLPYRDPAKLVLLDGYRKDRRGAGVGWADIENWKRSTNAFTAIAGCMPRTYGLALRKGEQSEVILSCQVTPDFFEVLSVLPVIGRPMAAHDGELGRRNVWLSHKLWQRRFHSDPQVTKTILALNEDPFFVAGVLPADFRYAGDGREPDLYFVIDRKDYGAQKAGGALTGMARLADGVSRASAEQQVNAIIARQSTHRDYTIRVEQLRDAWARNYRQPMFAFLAAVSLLLLIACLNVATLVLARALGKARDSAMRLAMGASLRDIIAGNLRESAVLAALGGAVGLAIAYALLEALNTAPRYLPRLPLLDPVQLNGFVFALVAAVCCGSAVLFALLPAVAVRRVDFVDVLRSGQSASRASVSWRQWLVFAQIACSVVLLANTLLLGRSFQRILATDPGFDVENVSLFGLGLPESRYNTDEKMAEFHRALQERLAQIPGVGAAAGSTSLPMSGSSGRSKFSIVGDNTTEERFGRLSVVTPGYFEALRIALKQGRVFTSSDRLGSTPVILINEIMARQYFTGRSPIGARLRIPWSSQTYPRNTEWQVIGVVADTRQGSLEQEILPEIYPAIAQLPSEGIFYILRSNRSATELTPLARQALASIDPSLEQITLRRMSDRLDGTLRDRRVALVMIGAFCALAVLLSVAGIGTLLSFLAIQRRREFGIRMAIGDTPRGLAALVIGQALRLTLVGVAAGLLVGSLASTWIRSQLYQTTPWDFTVLAAVVCLMLLMATAAALAPALRAARIDPAKVLRLE